MLLEPADLVLGVQEHQLGLVGALHLLAVEHQVLLGGIGAQLVVLAAQLGQGLVALGLGGAVAALVGAVLNEPYEAGEQQGSRGGQDE